MRMIIPTLFCRALSTSANELEPAAVLSSRSCGAKVYGACHSAVAVHATSRWWLLSKRLMRMKLLQFSRISWHCLPIVLCSFSTLVQAQFNYTTTNGSITITGYAGSDSAINIPDTISNQPVTSIGRFAFQHSDNTSSVEEILPVTSCSSPFAIATADSPNFLPSTWT